MIINLIIIALISYAISYEHNKMLINLLSRMSVIDVPNERSNHTIPKPRGGGLSIIISLMITAFACSFLFNVEYVIIKPILITTFVLSLIFFIDDIRSLSAKARFVIQALSCVIGVYYLPQETQLFPFMPVWFENILFFIALLWFTNLYNFMDGIDGISACETIFIATSIVCFAFYIHLPLELCYIPFILIFATFAFLYFNWSPSQIFMGDTGSIAIGFLLGWLLLYIAKIGYLYFALIIPSYYLMDATVTILTRLVQGKKIWQAHSEHYYQKAVRGGQSHLKVVIKISLFNLFLAITACIYVIFPEKGLILQLLTLLMTFVMLKCLT